MLELGLMMRDYYPLSSDVHTEEDQLWFDRFQAEWRRLQDIRPLHRRHSHPAELVMTASPPGFDYRAPPTLFPQTRVFVGTIFSISPTPIPNLPLPLLPNHHNNNNININNNNNNNNECTSLADDGKSSTSLANVQLPELAFLSQRDCNVYVAFGSLIWDLFTPRDLEHAAVFFRNILTAYPSCGLLVSVVAQHHDFFLKAVGEEGLLGGRVSLHAWVDQRAVLRHPSLLCFATHCGYSSLLEGLTARVPLLPVPFRGDNPDHARGMLRLGVAPLIVDIKHPEVALPPLEWWRSPVLKARMDSVQQTVSPALGPKRISDIVTAMLI